MPTGNWVDRGDALERVLARALAHMLHREATDAALTPHVLTIRGMVEADSTEVHIASYLRTVCATFGVDDLEPQARRTLAIALWHITKAGLVRDAMAREIAALRRLVPAGPALAEQLRDAILGAPTDPPARAPFVPPRPHEAAAKRRR